MPPGTGALAPTPPPSAPSVPDEDSDQLDLAELGEVCGMLYSDAFTAAAQWYVGEPLDFPADRAMRRGQQLALVLRKAGWSDDEVLAYMGITVGVIADFSMLQRAKNEKTARAETEHTATTPTKPRKDRKPNGKQ